MWLLSHLPMKKIHPAWLRSLWFRVLLSGLLAGATLFAVSSCTEPAETRNTVLGSQQTTSADFAHPPDPGLLLLLVPQGQLLTDPMLTAWLDAASEIGVRMQPITDRQFNRLGATALSYAGLILPDHLFMVADNGLLSSIRDYTQAGGQTMLVYDFGTLTLDFNAKPTYSIPKARLSDLAGVNYALYDMLREKSITNGSIAATRSTLRDLQVPPGKSSPYLVPASKVNGTATVAYSAPVADSSATTPAKVLSLNSAQMTYVAPANIPAVASEPLESYSGYLLGNLVYPSFVTHGTFTGIPLAVSAEAGLIAGLNKFGRGQVLFVNLPMTWLKVERTDGLLMHGFLRYFAHNVLRMAHLSAVPNGVAGLTLNWHLDSFFAQQPTLNLEQLGVFDEGPFSIHMTAGPDAIATGDGRGWNLDNNPQAQQILQRFAKKGHALGSHGGWNHDYYGLNANESNGSKFLPYLELNTNAIDRAVSHSVRGHLGLESSTPSGMAPVLLPMHQKLKSTVDRAFGPLLREYSPPVGNNPLWAMDWLEQHGVVGVYFGGHTGMGPTRQYREGQLRNRNMWMFPVTPFRRYATFEEFQTARTPKQAAQEWYRSSVDFTIDHNTTRMIYMHPNGANVWPDVLLDLLAYAKAKGETQFKWYTMTRLADFMTARQDVTWVEQRDASGLSRFGINHSSSLKEMVWLLPKSRYADLPVSADGSVTVSDQGANWAVRAGNTRVASFTAKTVMPKN